MTTTIKKPKATQPDTPSYANGGIQYTGAGATPAQTNNPYTTTRVTGISQKNSKGQDVPVPLNQPAQFGANVQYGAGGQMTGINFPDGRNFQNLQHDQVQSLLNDWNNTPENKIKADLAQQQLVKDVTAQNTPPDAPNVTAEQLAQLGQTNPNLQQQFMNNPTTQDIIGNVVKREQVLSGQMTNPDGTTNPPPLLNKLSSVLPNAVTDVISENKNVREYLQDYSNANNFKSVSSDIQNAQNNLRLAIRLANQPGDSQDAITAYNDALTRLRVANAQLKYIESYDQRAYVEDIKRKRIELENYLQYNVPTLNNQMQNALIKPDPKYYDTQVNQIMNGGGQ